MDKEKVITVLIGLIVGIALASAYFLGSKFLPKNLGKNEKIVFTPKEKPAPNKPAASLTLDQPQDSSSTKDNAVNLTGSAWPNASLVIFANADDQIASTDATGKFTAFVKLEEGENEITVTGIDPDGKTITLKRNVTLEIVQ